MADRSEPKHPHASARPPTWTEACWKLLGSGMPETLIRRLSPELLRGLTINAENLYASVTPASAEFTIIELRKLAAHYPMVVRTQAEETSRWNDWLEDLGDIPRDILTAGCAIWRRSDEAFFPAPGQLLAIIEQPARYRRWMAERMRDLSALTTCGDAIDTKRRAIAHMAREEDLIDRPPDPRGSALAQNLADKLTVRGGG